MRTEYEHLDLDPLPMEQNDPNFHHVRVLKSDDERIAHFKRLRYEIDESAHGNTSKLVIMKVPIEIKDGRYARSIDRATDFGGQTMRKAKALGAGAESGPNTEGLSITENRESLSEILSRIPAVDPVAPSDDDDLDDQ